jgi:hypothetical protein
MLLHHRDIKGPTLALGTPQQRVRWSHNQGANGTTRDFSVVSAGDARRVAGCYDRAREATDSQYAKERRRRLEAEH